jgi:TPP-dependent pyruvate/acetoin dehydrogenase alpha subunit
LKGILSQVEAEVNEAVRFAETSCMPEPRDMYTDVVVTE